MVGNFGTQLPDGEIKISNTTITSFLEEEEQKPEQPKRKRGRPKKSDQDPQAACISRGLDKMINRNPIKGDLVRNPNSVEIVKELLSQQSDLLSSSQLEQLKESLEITLSKYQIREDVERREILEIQQENAQIVRNYITAKKIEGKSNTTCYNYAKELTKLFLTLNKSFRYISSNDLRDYLAWRRDTSNLQAVSVANIRMYLVSFFKWLYIEELIKRNPMDKISAIKVEKKVVETLTEEEQEKIRCACTNQRDRAIIEMLSSTGMRISELCGLNIGDVNFDKNECKVFGKGSKERICFLTGKAKVHLQWYLEQRTDDNEALFVNAKYPYNRITKYGVNYILKEIQKKVDISANKFSSHIFRRSLASDLAAKGADINDIGKILGHANLSSIDHYVKINNDNLHAIHKKYIS